MVLLISQVWIGAFMFCLLLEGGTMFELFNQGFFYIYYFAPGGWVLHGPSNHPLLDWSIYIMWAC